MGERTGFEVCRRPRSKGVLIRPARRCRRPDAAARDRRRRPGFLVDTVERVRSARSCSDCPIDAADDPLAHLRVRRRATRRRPASHADPALRRTATLIDLASQRLPRPHPRSARRRGSRRRGADLGRRLHRLSPRHRLDAGPRRPRGGARRLRRRRGGARLLLAATSPTSRPSPRSPGAATSSSPTRRTTRRSSTRAGSRAPTSWSTRTATSALSTSHSPHAREERARRRHRRGVQRRRRRRTAGCAGRGAAAAHGALLIVDEAHALGVVGSGGQGAVARAGLAGAPDVVLTVTLSKSLGSQGGAVLGASGGRRPPRRRRASVHLRHRPRAGICRCGARRARRAPRRARARRAGRGTSRASSPLSPERPDGGPANLLRSSPSLLVGTPGRGGRGRRRVPAARRRTSAASVRPSVPDGVSRLRLTARADLTDDDLAWSTRVLTAVGTEYAS